ncbi:hypothetical protein OAH18_02000 [bacterium]|nr:hypothetical protein [bacterium]
MKKLGYLGLLCATFMFTSSMIGCGDAAVETPPVEEEMEHDEAAEYGDEAPGEDAGEGEAGEGEAGEGEGEEEAKGDE